MVIELDFTSVCRLMIACHLMKKRWQEEAKHDPSSESWQQVCQSAMNRWDLLHDELERQLERQLKEQQ